MNGVSRQDWWDEEPEEVVAGPPASVRKGSWFLAFLAASFFAMLFSVGLDKGLRLVEEGRLSLPAAWLDRVDLGLGLGLFFLGACVGLSFGRLGGLGGVRPALASFFWSLLGMSFLLLLQAGLLQPRILDQQAADLQTWLQARSLAVYGLALLGLLLAWFLPLRSRTR